MTIPMRCPVCYRKPAGYYGRLVFPEELTPSADRFNAVAESGGSISIPPVPVCPNHPAGYEHPLVPCGTRPDKIAAE